MSPKKIGCLLAGSVCLLGMSLNNTANQNSTVDDAEVNRVLNVSQDIAYGEYLAGECASCHSATVASGSNVPVIHGAAANYLVRALLEYRSGERENTTMKNVTSALGDEEIAVLAHYLATQEP
ncbi:MAG: cytochrome c553 [Granulosicoccus sp.]|jgi:cytochrome c553